MSRAKLERSRPGPAAPAHLHRRQLSEARLPGGGPGQGHPQRHHAPGARPPGAPGDGVLGAHPGGARPRRAGRRRAVPRGHGRVLRRDDARLRPGRPRPLLRKPLLPQAGHGGPGPLAGSHDGRLVAVDAVADDPAGEGHAHRAVHPDGLVVRRPLSGPQGGLPRARPSRSGRRSRRCCEAGRPDHPDRRARALGPAGRAAVRRRGDAPGRSTGFPPTTSSTRASAPSRRSIRGSSTCRSTTSTSRSRTARSTSWGCSRRTRSPRTSRSGCSTSTRTRWRRRTTSRRELRRGTSVLPADRIWVDPDCGLKTRTVEESRAKLGGHDGRRPGGARRAGLSVPDGLDGALLGGPLRHVRHAGATRPGPAPRGPDRGPGSALLGAAAPPVAAPLLPGVGLEAFYDAFLWSYQEAERLRAESHEEVPAAPAASSSSTAASGADPAAIPPALTERLLATHMACLAGRGRAACRGRASSSTG